MIRPVLQGDALVAQIEQTHANRPTLWWLGHSGFAVKYHRMIFYVDPYLSDQLAAQGERFARLTAAPLEGRQVRHADLVLVTHPHGGHMDAGALPDILQASPRAQVVLPKSAAGQAQGIGIPYDRMRTTDAGLRVEYFKDGDYARVYAVPSAHEALDWTPLGGHPYLGYLIRCGDSTIYHAGDCIPYEGLADRLRPYSVTVALVPINGRDPSRGVPGNFDVAEAAQLAEDIGARWVVPMHYEMFAFSNVDVSRFVDHLLGRRPGLRFKIFQCGERWTVPAD